MLHAWRLGLFHPRTDSWMESEAPLPADFASRLHTEPSTNTAPITMHLPHLPVMILGSWKAIDPDIPRLREILATLSSRKNTTW